MILRCIAPGTHLAEKRDIETIILRPKTDLGTLTKKAVDRPRKYLRELILDPMEQDELRWTQAARRKCDKWSELSNSQHLQLLRKNGLRLARGQTTYVNWNGDLAKIHDRKVEKYVYNLHRALQKEHKDFEREVDALHRRPAIEITSNSF